MSGLLWESEERQVSTLLYYLGEEAKDILASTNIEEEDRKKYDSVLAKFDSFFSVRKKLDYRARQVQQMFPTVRRTCKTVHR